MKPFILLILLAGHSFAAEKRHECDLIDPTLGRELVKHQGPGCFVEKYWSSVEPELDPVLLPVGSKALVRKNDKFVPATLPDFLHNESIRFVNEKDDVKGNYSPRLNVKSLSAKKYLSAENGKETSITLEKFGFFKRLRHEIRPTNSLNGNYEFDIICLEVDFKSKCSHELGPHEGVHDSERGFVKEVPGSKKKEKKLQKSSKQ